MKLAYRSEKNADAAARYWGKSLEKPDWYKIEALSDDESEIMIYDVIGWPFIDAAEFVRSLNEIKQGKITVRINSPGGDVFDAMAIFNALASHKAKIVTRIESLAASSASFIALAGKERQAYKNAMIMIHEPWAVTAGNQYDFREIADILEKISGNMVDTYASNTSVGKREIKDMMKAETWLTAKEATEKGFIDSIVDGKSVKAQFDLSIFANTPEGLSDGTPIEQTEREKEKALRDVGFSQKDAKAILSGRKDGTQRDVEGIQAEVDRIINMMK